MVEQHLLSTLVFFFKESSYRASNKVYEAAWKLKQCLEQRPKAKKLTTSLSIISVRVSNLSVYCIIMCSRAVRSGVAGPAHFSCQFFPRRAYKL